MPRASELHTCTKSQGSQKKVQCWEHADVPGSKQQLLLLLLLLLQNKSFRKLFCHKNN